MTLYGWGPGSGPFILPPEAGFRVGQENGTIQFLALQTHYDNPTGISGVQDVSGVRLYMTPTLRTYDASALTIGDARVSSPDLPAGESAIEYEYECPSDCTGTWPQEINVFGSFSHAHQLATKMYSSHWRNVSFL